MTMEGKGEIILYTSSDGASKIEVTLQDETVWLSIDQMAELFQRNKSTISRHIKNIFEDGELNREVVVAKNATTTQHGAIKGKTQTHLVEFYNLDMIISVGYRVNSYRGVQFRQWATAVLKEYLKKGFALNDDLLKNAGGGNYFDELLARIRDIRSSEKVFYRKVLEIYALSIDYDPRVEMTKQFFATVQNKMHYAVHGHTAAEIIYNRADAAKDFMGLTAWTGMMPKRTDAEYAKNYLNEEEIDMLNRIVNLYIDFAEIRAKDHKPMYMRDWIAKLDDFLRLSDKEILANAGTISAKLAKEKADAEYNKFKERTSMELSPVEIHFLENFEKERKRILSKGKQEPSI
ncbi:MAG: virulence RhuM family protein [Bacteroidales bacterium]|nr:virulence RhuM family protein [Bacteroidales bacterium]